MCASAQRRNYESAASRSSGNPSVAPKISVIMTSYNHEHFVAEAIQSVLDQDLPDWELVIRDDGSSDATPQIIASFRDPRIRYLGSGKNVGAAQSANLCVRAARAPYIAILNSDDVFESRKLSVQMDFLDSHPDVAAVFSRPRLITEAGESFAGGIHWNDMFAKANRSRHEWLRYFFFQGNCLCDPSVLVRKHLYDDIGLYDSRMAAFPDFDLWIRASLKYDIYILPDNLVRFRIRSNEDNESGDRPVNYVRAVAEYFFCLSHYRHLSPDDFWKVFPDTAPACESAWFDVEFALARLCLAQERQVLRRFGAQLLYELAGDDGRMAEITSHVGYGYPDLHRDLATVDVDRVAGPCYLAKTHLYLGRPDSATPVASSRLNLGAHACFDVTFILPREFDDGGDMLWSPLEHHACTIREAMVESNLGPLRLSADNAYDHIDGSDWFIVARPLFRIQREQSAKVTVDGVDGWVRISGRIQALSEDAIAAEVDKLKARLLAGEAQRKADEILTSSLRMEISRLTRLLEYHTATPMRALSFWWNRKSTLT
jgi:glycosyltransferase involved in cell wall biosynthesis